MSNLSALELGKRALMAQRFGLDVTSNNIANVNTPGYARRTAVLSETDPINEFGKYRGSGVTADTLRSFRQEYFDKEIRSSSSRSSSYSVDEEMLQQVQTVLAEPSDIGLNELTTEYLDSFNQLALTPENMGLRQNVLDQTVTLAERLNSVSAGLTEVRTDALKTLHTHSAKINSLLKDIAGLNTNISQTKSPEGADVATYVDKRELKLEDLSKLVNINTGNNEDGSINVFVNGINLVTGQYSSEVNVLESVNSSTGEKSVKLQKFDPDNKITSELDPSAGEVASLIKHYNVTLDEKESSGEYSIMKKLNDFASALVKKVNTFTAEGFGLDDKGPAPAGRFIFEPGVGEVTAGNIKISSDVKDLPRALPVSDKPGENGNSKVAMQIGRIAQDSTFLDGMTPAGFYSGFISKVGSMLQDSTLGKTTTNLVSDQLEQQRESNIGVNLDEEAVNLIKYQKAFEAASRIISVTNEMLGTIVNLGK